jgi:hypothetical protein
MSRQHKILKYQAFMDPGQALRAFRDDTSLCTMREEICARAI